MVRTNVTRIGKSLAKLRKGDFVGAANELGVTPTRGNDQKRSTANGWLELQYGWRPLVSDVYGAANHLDKRVKQQFRQYQRQHGRSQFKEATVTTAVNKNTTTITTVSLLVKARCDVVYMTDDVVLAEFTQLGLTNPTVLAWELTPYSFVFDWFIHVGNWLSSLDALYSRSFFAASVTTSHEITLFETRSIKGPITGGSESGYWEKADSDFAVSRAPKTSAPFAILPVFKNPVSLTHALNGISLLNNSRRK